MNNKKGRGTLKGTRDARKRQDAHIDIILPASSFQLPTLFNKTQSKLVKLTKINNDAIIRDTYR